MKKFVLTSLAAAAVVLAGTNAHAEGRVIQLPGWVIVGHVQRPMVVVEANKVEPKLTLTELRQPFVERVETATQTSPF